MTDEIDLANEAVERFRDMAIASAKARHMPEGSPGECEWCGEENARIVNGHCSKCRDELGLD